MGLPCPSASSGVSASSPPSSGGVSPLPTGPNASCQLSSDYASCLQTCDQNFGPDDEQNLPLWTECRNSCNQNACSGTCNSGESCQANTEVVTRNIPLTGYYYSIEEVKSCGCIRSQSNFQCAQNTDRVNTSGTNRFRPGIDFCQDNCDIFTDINNSKYICSANCTCAPVPPVTPNQTSCSLSPSYSACLQACSLKSGDEAFACYKSCANQYSFQPAGVAANSVCSGDACKDSSGKPLGGYCRPTAYSNKQNSAGEQVLLATACGCQSPTFGALYYCNAPGDLSSQNTYPGTALGNLKPGDKWAGGGVFCRDECSRFGSQFSCSARNSGCFCECDAAKLNCSANQTADTKNCKCVASETRNETGNFSGNGTAGGCGNGTACCGSASDLTCGGSCPQGQLCSAVGYNASGQNLSLGRNVCQCIGPQLVDTPCNMTSDCNGYCGVSGTWCALSKGGACVCTRTPEKVHVDVLVEKPATKVGETSPIRAHVYWDDGTPATGSVTFVLGASSRSEALAGGWAQAWGLCLASGTTPASAVYHGVRGSAPFTCVD